MKLSEAAKKYLGVKFRHQGRSEMGLDCLGLLILSAQDIGITLNDLKGYARAPDGDKLKHEADKQLIKISINDAVDGDIFLMKFKREPQHIAIKTKIGIIHSYQSAGAVVEHTLNQQWLDRIVGVYKLWQR